MRKSVNIGASCCGGEAVGGGGGGGSVERFLLLPRPCFWKPPHAECEILCRPDCGRHSHKTGAPGAAHVPLRLGSQLLGVYKYDAHTCAVTIYLFICLSMYLSVLSIHPTMYLLVHLQPHHSERKEKLCCSRDGHRRPKGSGMPVLKSMSCSPLKRTPCKIKIKGAVLTTWEAHWLSWAEGTCMSWLSCEVFKSECKVGSPESGGSGAML